VKSALVLCRTPFQASLIEKILREENIDLFDLVYYTQQDSTEDRHYFGILAARARSSVYIYRPPRRYSILSYFELYLGSLNYLRDRRPAIVVLASFDNHIFNSIASRQKDAKLVTFDDGTANIFSQGTYFYTDRGWRTQLYRRAFGAVDPDLLKWRVSTHYTVFENYRNIVPAHKVKTIRRNNRLRPSELGKPLVFFIGGPFHESCSDDELHRLSEYIGTCGIDYYVTHPRETVPIYSEAKFLNKNGMLAEDAILQASEHVKPIVISHASTVLFNLGAQDARKVMVLFEGNPQTEEISRLAQQSGCEIVLI